MTPIFRRMRVIPPLAIVLSLLMGMAPKPASAAALPDEYDVSCREGVCQLAVSLDEVAPILKLGAGLVLNAAQDKLEFLPDGAGVTVSDDLTLSLPVGDIELLDADLNLKLDADGQLQSIRGAAQAPFPTLGLFDDSEITTPALAEVGFDRGSNLQRFEAPLLPDHHYLFFNIGSDFAAHTRSGDSSQKFRLTAPEGQSASLIIDVDEPFMYLTGDLSIDVDGELSLLQQALVGGATPFSLQMLPVGQQAALQLDGALGADLQRSYLQIGGGYAVDGGLIGDKLGLDVTPLAVEGVLAISSEGMQVDGVLQSKFQPESLFDGEVAIQARLPFNRPIVESYAQIDGSLSVPVARIQGDVSARVDGEDITELAGRGKLAVDSARESIAPATQRLSAQSGLALDFAQTLVQQNAGKMTGAYGNLSDRALNWYGAMFNRTAPVSEQAAR
ncbi:MAG: hypothetical protein J5I90_14210 [Caldilineales bacterium]|nr:hypothetical protein [Caldilineales bacterium]